MIINLLISSFITIFIAELGDKTQLATLTLSGNSKKPWAVFLGSSSALIIATLIGVLAGGSISTFIPEIYLKIIASLTFLIIGSKLIYNSFKMEKSKSQN
tara:strand:- start:155 stop:454 length:300 start_codon:yes stop_codon:yes gene_type:complete